jgi:XTP/dITP diphosphohydrolase
MAAVTLVMATRNAGKVREMAELLGDLGVKLLGLADFPEIPDIPEEGATFAENALAKAKTVARLAGLPALADDSGLEVEALGGRPGVLSARYAQDRTAGLIPTDQDNWQKLLDELREVPQEKRQARFVCEIALYFPDGRLLTARGELAGLIAFKPQGTRGFGYDPVFWVPAYEAMVAELDLATKNRISHRGQALRKLKEILAARREEFFATPVP